MQGHVMVCDGCERGFHLGCAGVRGRQAVSLGDWICRECESGCIKSKRWPLGVKSKQILDINASPPSEGDGEGTEELLNFRKQTAGDNSFGGNACGDTLTYSNILCAGNGFGFKKGSRLMMHAFRVGFEDLLQHTETVDEVDLGFPIGRLRSRNNTAIRLPSQNPNEVFLQGLREFISERHGVLEEGWRVEFKHSVSSYELYAVYCSPDGKIFGSMPEVACHLGLMSNCISLENDNRSDGSPSLQGRLHLPKKRKSKRSVLANGFAENKETPVNGCCKELLSNGQGTEVANAKLDNVSETEMGKDEITKSEPSNEGLPFQFDDFFVLSLGKIDARPSYHDVSQIWPIGYRSCWHDKVTGSLFMSEVSDGGDSGPVFKVRRFSCSAFTVPEGSTVLLRTNLGQLDGQNSKESNNIISYDMDCENDLEMILADPAPPTDYDILSCLQCSSHASEVQMSDSLQTSSLHSMSVNILSSNLELGDEIGEISVEERSSSSAWRRVSQKLIDAYAEIFRRRGTLKLTCNHVDHEMGSPILDIKGEKSEVSFVSLAKFCSSPSILSIPTEYQGELDTLSTTLAKWVDQDRFGFDAEFVQEIIEQLPGVEACSKYEFLINRGHYSASLTIGNGILMAKRKSEPESDDSFQVSKKPRLLEKSDPPPGRLLCSRLPSALAGDFYQVWEILWRFHEVLDLKEPLSLDELEAELINPWSDGSNLLDNLKKKVQGSQVVDLNRVDMSRQISSSCDESLMVVHGDNSHVLIQVETGVMKDASAIHSRCSGGALTKAHSSLLHVLISELQSRVAALVDPNFDSGELKSKRGRRKDVDSSVPVIRSKLNVLPLNELTWPELARRYILAFLSMDANLDSTDITARESGKVFRCLQGDGGVLCGSLTGVAGMEADAILLAEATKQIFGSLSRKNDVITIEDEVADANGVCENNNSNDGYIPEWARMLEPVRKLPTNVGTRIRKCVFDALEKCPPEWAKKRLEHSISKEVYKGNASGPTKKAVLAVLADVMSEGLQQKSDNRNKRKMAIPMSDIIMKQCRIVLRRTAAADDEKIFCTLLGRNLIRSCDNDDEGLLGAPAMVSRPLDFRTIDLRLAVGAYGGSHESFLEDVRELWNNVRTAFGDQPDSVELADTLSQNFESLYEKEVVSLFQKFEEYSKLDHISAETKKELDDVLSSTNEIPKAPWDDGVCKVCGVDKDDDSVLLCDTCDAEYHTYCLNPPLARIPEGNWYCPSCVVGGCMVQEPLGNTQVISRGRCKKYQGEVSLAYLEALTHLAAAMEEKEYWEFSVDEKTFLLKFLCDELLNSALIRQHLEQCVEMTAELQQKLRSHSVDWKNLKSKEEFLASRASKMDNTVGGVKEGTASGITTQDECVEQPLLPKLSDRDSHSSGLSDDMQAPEGGQEGTGINSIKGHSEKNHCYNSQTIKPMDAAGQRKVMHALVVDNSVPSQENDKSLESNQLPSPNHVAQALVSRGEIQFQGNLQGHVGRDTSTVLPPPEDGGFCISSEMNSHADQHVPPSTSNESQAYHLELSTIKNDILDLQNSITNIESQLLKLSVRREFLGSDSRGRLYWASATPGRHPSIIVDESFTMLTLKIQDRRDLLDSGSDQNSASSVVNAHLNLEGSKACFPFVHNSNCAMSGSSSWVSYETDAEIGELVGWLKDDEHKERDLKESILQWLKLRFQETHHTRNLAEEGHQTTLSMMSNEETAFSNCLVTKAAMFLEKKYGSCIELDTNDMLKSRGKKARVTDKEKMCRCECLEPICPSRPHCHSCHRTFSCDVEFEGHDDGRCNLVPPAHGKSAEIKDSLKVKGSVKPDTSKEECITKMDVVGTSKTGWSELSSRLIKFQNEGMVSPYDFGEISSKLVTKDSNRELVQEIGLLGSNGVPSFVTSISPFLSDSTLMLVPPEEDTSVLGLDNFDERLAFSQGNRSEANACLQSISDKSSRRTAANEIGEALITNKPSLGCLEQIGRKSALNKRFPGVGAGGCCVIPQSSVRPLVGKVSPILLQLKINLLDMEAALPEEARRPSKAQLERRWAWRAYVKSAESIYQMVQATIILEEMIKTEYLRNEWWYWSSLSAAAKTSTVASLALRIYSLDAAIVYERNLSNSDLSDCLKLGSMLDQKPLPGSGRVEKCKVSRKSTKRRKEREGLSWDL